MSNQSTGSRSHLSRRTVLRGMGAAIALPWLESMTATPSWGAAASIAGQTDGPPLRTAFLFVPNGVHLPDWTPQSEGYGYDLPYILEPLERVRDDVSVLTGLTHDKGRANGDGPGDHARSASVFLTGSQPGKTSGEDIRVGVSVNQVAAQKIGHMTRFPSLELGTERGRDAGNCDSGYSCAYSSNISWSAPSSPVGKEINPRAVFDRLFSGGKAASVDKNRHLRDEMRLSILDFVAEDAQRIQRGLGQQDRQKVDEYLSGIRQIEQRLTRIDSAEGADRIVRGYPAPAARPEEYDEHIRLMCDMMVLAFQTDTTRIATFMLANAGSNRSYRPIGVPDGHHDLSHHGGDPKKHAKIRKINHFHMTQFAYLLERLKAIREGEGTLLDHCMIVYGSGLSDGNRHNNEDLPVLLAGRGGGLIESGRHIRYRHETPMNNLYMSILERIGAPVDFIGDSTGRLPNLDV